MIAFHRTTCRFRQRGFFPGCMSSSQWVLEEYSSWNLIKSAILFCSKQCKAVSRPMIAQAELDRMRPKFFKVHHGWLSSERKRMIMMMVILFRWSNTLSQQILIPTFNSDIHVFFVSPLATWPTVHRARVYAHTITQGAYLAGALRHYALYTPPVPITYEYHPFTV